MSTSVRKSLVTGPRPGPSPEPRPEPRLPIPDPKDRAPWRGFGSAIKRKKD